ncbi:MAG TPA: glutathione S-transferase family protein [Elainellaceae cyanobacterium]
MLTFYYHPLSPIARRVWIALLEKDIPFKPVVVNLNGEQLRPEFLSLNPFHHVPVVVDGDFRIIESLAILDYLEATYPVPSLVPQNPQAIARMRMVQMVTIHELTPKLAALVRVGENPESDQAIIQHVTNVLDFLTEQLGDAAYFGGEHLSLADVTAGATLPLLHRLGVGFAGHPAIAAWFDRIMARASWQQTEPDDDAFNTWRRWIALMIKRRQRQLSRA